MIASQYLTFEVRGTSVPLSHTCNWLPDVDAPECTIEMPKDSSILIRLKSVGKVDIDGDLEFDNSPSNEGQLVLRWKASAKAEDSGSCTVTLSHPNDDFNDVTITVDMSEDASLKVEEAEEPEPPAPPLTNNDFVNRYGAYGCCVIAALGALIFALIMPAHSSELISGAAAIAIWGFWGTSENDRFVWRILGFIAAGVTMCFALAMPGNAESLIEGAGALCALSIWLGDR